MLSLCDSLQSGSPQTDFFPKEKAAREDRYKEAKGGGNSRVGDARRHPHIRKWQKRDKYTSQGEGCVIQMASFVAHRSSTLSAKYLLPPL